MSEQGESFESLLQEYADQERGANQFLINLTLDDTRDSISYQQSMEIISNFKKFSQLIISEAVTIQNPSGLEISRKKIIEKQNQAILLLKEDGSSKLIPDVNQISINTLIEIQKLLKNCYSKIQQKQKTRGVIFLQDEIKREKKINEAIKKQKPNKLEELLQKKLQQ